MKYDFSGYATRNNIKCSDGRIIMRDAFKDNDDKKVPLAARSYVPRQRFRSCYA